MRGGGGVVGAFLYARVGYGALFVPITIVLAVAFFYNHASERLPEKCQRRKKGAHQSNKRFSYNL
ncbi:uncharacterized membrane protein YoaK (UPF0700 family) [Psychrobacter sp. PL19]